jgi:transposase
VHLEPTSICRALVGLADIDVVGVIGWTMPRRVHIASTLPRPTCSSCGIPARIKQTMRRRLVDLPSFGRPVVTVWRQVRWRCPAPVCAVGSWMQTDERIVIGNRGITDRAARWACEQVGRHGRSVAEVAADLGCDWHTVNRAVIGYGLALVDDPDRIGPVTTLGLDETAFVRVGRWRHRLWSTQLVGDNQLLDVVQGRDAAPACAWLAARAEDWRAGIEWVTLDLAGSYRSVADTMLPDAQQVADPFHVVRAANERLDEVRRRVQNETLGHRGRKSDPLYRTRRLLVMADERLDDSARERRQGLLAAGDPKGHVRDAWTADRRRCVRSTGSATPTSLSSGCKSSLPPSTTGSTAPRSADSDACSPGGPLRSRRGTVHAPATAPWRPSTASPSASSGSPSGSRTGPTGASVCCATPAVPTGPSSPPSPPPPRELPKSPIGHGEIG